MLCRLLYGSRKSVLMLKDFKGSSLVSLVSHKRERRRDEGFVVVVLVSSDTVTVHSE